MSDNFSDTFFNKDNCRKIGFIREDIEKQFGSNKINERERAILITSLLYSMDKIENTCGHYDAYRKNGDLNKKLELLLPVPDSGLKNNQIYNEDANNLVKRIEAKTNKDVEDSMLNFALKIVRGIIYVIAVFIVLTILEINLSGLVAGLGLGGVIVTLAAQDTAKNLFGGLVIFLDKPFVVGDWIEVDKYEGTVEDITFRSTRVRTFENSVVNIPNAVIANDSIINWSRMEKRRNKVNWCIKIVWV